MEIIHQCRDADVLECGSHIYTKFQHTGTTYTWAMPSDITSPLTLQQGWGIFQQQNLVLIK